MSTQDSDRYWQTLGDSNPYWGVLTADTFHADNLTGAAVEELYSSGEAQIDSVFEVVRRHLDADFTPASALDFGCGVGRLLIPLAQRCGAALGIDVSDGMLQRARSRCDRLGLSNVRLLQDGGELAGVSERFDLIHSFIVFQHIPCPRGEAIARRLLQLLNDGGVGVLHFTYFKMPRSRRHKLRRIIEWLRLYRLASAIRGCAAGLYRTLTGRAWGDAEMQMNPYNLNAIFLALQQAGVRRIHLEYTDHGGNFGVILFFQKSGADHYLA
jgi:SAM-dependent methyltransferase